MKSITKTIAIFGILHFGIITSYSHECAADESRKLIQEKKREEVVKELALKGDDQVVECRLEIQDVPCLSKTELLVRLKNELGTVFSSNQITTSCGCVSNLPKEWSVEPGETKEFSFVFTAPKTDEKIERHITLSDATLGRSIRLSLKCEAKSAIKLNKAIIEFPTEDPQTITIPIETRFDGFDLRKLSVQVQSSETVEASLQATSAQKGELQLKVSPNANPDNVQSTCSLEFLEQGQVQAGGSIFIRFPNRTIAHPNTLEIGSKTVNGNLIIYSLKLHDELRKGSKLEGEWQIDGKPHTKLEKCTAKSTDSPVSVIQIEISPEKLLGIKKQRSLLLQCGEWKSEIKVK